MNQVSLEIAYARTSCRFLICTIVAIALVELLLILTMSAILLRENLACP